MKFKSNRSFTLIELLVVIAIIGLLAGVAVASLNNARVRARDAKRVGDISQITKAIELAFAFNGSYPIPTGNTTTCLSTCTTSNWCANIMAQIPNLPNDPLPNQYCYQYNSDGSNFRIAAQLESPGNANIAQNDGGLYAQYYEGYSAPSLIWLGWVKYASAAGGNWSSDSGTWVTASGGSTVTTHPIVGDTVYLDANSGNVTVDTNSAAMTLDLTGYRNTLAIGTKDLIISGNSTITTSIGQVATVTIGASDNIGWSTTDMTIGIRGVVTCSGNSKITVSGSWSSSAGTFTRSTSTVTFNATTTGNIISVGISNYLYYVIFNGSGGEWSLTAIAYTYVPTFTSGTLNLNGQTLTGQGVIAIGNGFTLNVGTGSLSASNAISLTVPTGATLNVSTGNVFLASLNVSGTGTFNCSGAATIIPWGDVSITSPNFSAGTSTFYQKYSTKTISSTQPLYNYTVGTGSGTDYDIAITLQSNLTVLNNFTIQYVAGKTRSFNAGSYTLNIGGNFTNNDTFTPGTSTVNFNDATKVSTISGSTTFNNLTSSTPDKTIKFTAGTTQTVSSLSLTGTSGHLITIDTDTGAGTFNLSDTTGTNTLYYTSVTRSAAAGGATWNALVSDGNSNGGSNSGWNF